MDASTCIICLTDTPVLQQLPCGVCKGSNKIHNACLSQHLNSRYRPRYNEQLIIDGCPLCKKQLVWSPELETLIFTFLRYTWKKLMESIVALLLLAYYTTPSTISQLITITVIILLSLFTAESFRRINLYPTLGFGVHAVVCGIIDFVLIQRLPVSRWISVLLWQNIILHSMVCSAALLTSMTIFLETVSLLPALALNRRVKRWTLVFVTK